MDDVLRQDELKGDDGNDAVLSMDFLEIALLDPHVVYAAHSC